MSELEKINIEIAKLKLAQEQQKLEQLQKRQRAINHIEEAATTATTIATNTGIKLLSYIGRWLFYFFATCFIGLLLLLMFNKPFQHANGFLYATGELLGKHSDPIIISLMLTPTLTAFFPLSKIGKGNVEALLGIIPLTIFAIWYLL